VLEPKCALPFLISVAITEGFGRGPSTFCQVYKKQPRSPVPFSVVSLVRLHNGAEVFALVDSCADSTAAVLATAQ
jgi:hypothetical protein